MRHILVVSFAAAATLVASSVRADDKAVCLDASSQGQTLRDAHRLVEARDKFRACAQQGCPAIIQADCSTWLEQVQASLPTVVPFATDAAGNGVPGVKVAMDGKLLLEKIEGRSLEVNPGTHTFTFESPDGTNVDKTVVIGEGQKETRVAAVVVKPSDTPAPTLTPALSPSPAPAPTPDSGPPWKTIGLVTGGVGVVGLGIGAVFGLMASSKKSDAGCASNGACPSQDGVNKLNDSLSAGNLSTVFFIAGGVLAAAGVTIFVLAPGAPMQVAPSVGANEAGLALRGTW
jgi:hypothetical protein